jgi:hypothetical protein
MHTESNRLCMVYYRGGHKYLYVKKKRESKFLVKSLVEQSTNWIVSGGTQCCYRTFDLNEDTVLAVQLSHKVRLPQCLRVIPGTGLCFASVMGGWCFDWVGNCRNGWQKGSTERRLQFLSVLLLGYMFSTFWKPVVRQSNTHEQMFKYSPLELFFFFPGIFQVSTLQKLELCKPKVDKNNNVY